MTKIRGAITVLFSFGAILLLGGVGSAQSARTFVSAQTGSDSNTASACGLAAPCRTFAAALTVTRSAGEIVVEDSGGYGAVTINQAVKIHSAPGIYAGITVSTPSDAVLVAAGSGDEVVLRGLTITQIGSGTFGSGIIINSAASVHVEGCTISGFRNGILSQTGGFNNNLYVNDTLIRKCVVGILASPNGNLTVASVDHCRIEGNSTGIATNDFVKTTVRESVLAGNQDGLIVEASVISGSAELNVENCEVFGNQLIGIVATAIGSGSSATARVSGTMITGNVNGIFTSVAGGTASIVSYGTNKLAGNGTDGSFTSTIGLQ